MSSTLLQKAQQALNEKTTKIIPGNIKQGVTVFGVTGTYGGGGGTPTKVDVDFNSTVTLRCATLASIIENGTTADEQAELITCNTSVDRKSIILTSGNHIDGSDAVQAMDLCISVGPEEIWVSMIGYNESWASATALAYKTILAEESSAEIPDEPTIADIIGLLEELGDNVDISFNTWEQQLQSNDTFSFYTPINSIYIQGQEISKLIFPSEDFIIVG